MNAQNGTSQDEREFVQLRDGFFDVDEMDFLSLMSVAGEFASLMKFFNLNNQIEGNWKTYFARDEAMVMAEIRMLASEKILTDLQETQTGFWLAPFVNQFESLGAQLVEQGSSAVVDLGHLILELCEKMNELSQSSQVEEDVEQVQLSTTSLSDSVSRIESVASDQKFRSQVYSMNKAIEMAQGVTISTLPATLRNMQHDPGVGLLIAFLLLYKEAQTKINRFTQRHLDFYYSKVLLMQPRPSQRDRTFLVFEPSLPGSRISVPRRTEFLARYDQQLPELSFSNDDEVTITDATVVSLQTLYFERNSANSPENSMTEMIRGKSMQYPTSAWVNTIPVVSAEAAVDVVKLAPYSLFGAPKNAGSSNAGRHARIGFALASEVLLLSAGRRKVVLKLQLGTSFGATENGFSGHRDQENTFSSRMAQLAESLEMLRSDVDYKILRTMFSISLTTPESWLEILEYDASLDHDNNLLHVSFVLAPEAPAISRYLNSIHGEDYATDSPLIKLELSNTGYLYPYGLLRDISISTAQIDVEVVGHRDLALYNNIGQVSAAMPFNPFGPIPDVGSYLIAGATETAHKNLTDFELEVEWGGLPRNTGGFKQYYSTYQEAPEFDEISGRIQTLSGGKWLPALGSSVPLFKFFTGDAGSSNRRGINSSAGDQSLQFTEIVTFKSVLAYASSANEVGVDDELIYSPSTKGGFFKITLDRPSFMFGHQQYQLSLTNALTINNAPRSKLLPDWLQTEKRLLPSAPYTPLINAIALNYKASSVIQLNLGATSKKNTESAFFHLHPAGWESIQASTDSHVPLVPQIYASGNLVIGLRAAQMLSGRLTLFFQMKENALPMLSESSNQLMWFYLSKNSWKILDRARIVSDSSHGFLKQGIVTIDVPSDISQDNSILGQGLYWIRVACDSDIDKFCDLYTVHTQALQVHRDENPDTKTAPLSIPPACIQRPRKAIPGIGKITQIGPSYGGRASESLAKLRTRTAERLRHKKRAITAHDYERLVLEEFPDIARVKCFPNLSIRHAPDGSYCPGNVLLVVLPHLVSRGHLTLLPTVDAFLLSKVKTFIMELASPSARIEVANPVYQLIQVRCKVNFKIGQDEGRGINMLDEALSDFISPWSSLGETNHFGWRLRKHEIESFILQQDFVEKVSQFSMLSIIGSDVNRFNLSDTAAVNADVNANGDILPKYPWCLAAPIKRHAIDAGEIKSVVPGLHVGIGKLEIGNTFIISAG